MAAEYSPTTQELHELERSQRLANIEKALEKDSISLSELFGSSFIFRRLRPGPITDTRAIHPPSFRALFPDAESHPRKTDPEYAEYVAKALGRVNTAMMVGDSRSDFMVAEHLRKLGVASHAVIVNSEMRNKAKSSLSVPVNGSNNGSAHLHLHGEESPTHRWYGDDWTVMDEAMQELHIAAEGVDPNDVVVLVDLDKTVIGPVTKHIETEEGPVDASSFIDLSRRRAVAAFAEQELFSDISGSRRKLVMNGWKMMYRAVKKSEAASHWDDEDTNAFLTALVFFGVMEVDDLEGMDEGQSRDFLLKQSYALRELNEEDIDVGGLDESWQRFKDISEEIALNVENGLATPFERFRMYEHAALLELFDQGKVAMNKDVIMGIQDALQHGYRVYALSDKPDAVVGMPESEHLQRYVQGNMMEKQGRIV